MSAEKFDHPADKRLITGTSGTGKTTLFEKMLTAEKARWKFVFDAKHGEFARRFDHPPCFSADDLCAAMEAGPWVVFDPIRLFPGRPYAGLAFFADFVLAVSTKFKGRKIFAVEELQKLQTPKKDPVELLTLLDTGRTFQLDFFAISQSPNRIHNAVRNQLTKLWTFRQSDANAVKYLAENGFDSEKVTSLPRGKFLWKNLDTGETGEGGTAF